ncbi:unnamed protein product [Polarella glacialis]|uniref:Uncharacterized protein n=1 Tax=Polarella glacialis TaxID=89957 RepID=A0A813HJB6_POLGL|nr:unnamed protein product [Polarella glacialis]CAE8678642.1 unnamed protein product [Polarella glacialis]
MGMALVAPGGFCELGWSAQHCPKAAVRLSADGHCPAAASSCLRSRGPAILWPTVATLLVAAGGSERRSCRRRRTGKKRDIGFCRRQATGGESGIDISELSSRIASLRALRVRDLKRELTALGLQTEGCVDRDSLLELLERQAPAVLLRRPSEASVSRPTAEVVETPKPITFPRNKDHWTHSRIFMKTYEDQRVLASAGSSKVITLDLQIGTTAVRFMVDMASRHSVIKTIIAKRISAVDVGKPAWASAEARSKGIRQVSLGKVWFGNLDCGPLELAAVSEGIQTPMGCAGILGLDFLAGFDWEFDVANERVRAFRIMKGALPFDVSSMISVPLQKVRLPTGADLLGCRMEVRRPGRSLEEPGGCCMAFPDMAAPRTMCTWAAVSALNIKEPDKATSLDGSILAASASEHQRCQTADLHLRLTIGDGHVETLACVGDAEAFKDLELLTWPSAILGTDVLFRERFILSVRLSMIWLSP